jgi:flavin reductase (DIM6/NTAB) family NADH-FMN oxidoreductase RutF
MDAQVKKTALRMIPYGLYVLTGESKDGRIAAATVNWVTQASFEPPLVVVGVKADSASHEIIKDAGSFALNVLGKGQQDLAFGFFKPLEREGDSIGGQAFSIGSSGAPLFANAAGYFGCTLVDTVERGDHSIFVGEVVEAAVAEEPGGRPDAVTLLLEDLGEKTFYGG